MATETRSAIVPDWVNSQQFADVLRANYEDFEEICNFTAGAALGGGENYLTTILRLTIDAKMQGTLVQHKSTKTFRFILKIPLTNGNEEFHELFVAEVDMYARIVPELERIYQMFRQRVQFKPKNFTFTRPPNCDYILMEDLQCKGYKNYNRLEGLDEAHTKYTLSKLAQWHAVSAKRVEMHGDYEQDYKVGYFEAQHLEMINGMNETFRLPFTECMMNYALPTAIKSKIITYMTQLSQLYLQFGQVKEDHFNVLNHGDFWVNNFMFQYQNSENAEIKEILFVDFQLPKYGTPAQDLFCFLMTSPNIKFKLSKFDDFVSHYHEELVKNLQLLEYKRSLPTLKSIFDILQKGGLWAFVCAQRMLPIALLPPSVHSNIDSFMSNSKEGFDFKKRLLQNPAYVQQIEQIIPWLLKRNYLQNL